MPHPSPNLNRAIVLGLPIPSSPHPTCGRPYHIRIHAIVYILFILYGTPNLSTILTTNGTTPSAHITRSRPHLLHRRNLICTQRLLTLFSSPRQTTYNLWIATTTSYSVLPGRLTYTVSHHQSKHTRMPSLIRPSISLLTPSFLPA